MLPLTFERLETSLRNTDTSNMEHYQIHVCLRICEVSEDLINQNNNKSYVFSGGSDNGFANALAAYETLKNEFASIIPILASRLPFEQIGDLEISKNCERIQALITQYTDVKLKETWPDSPFSQSAVLRRFEVSFKPRYKYCYVDYDCKVQRSADGELRTNLRIEEEDARFTDHGSSWLSIATVSLLKRSKI